MSTSTNNTCAGCLATITDRRFLRCCLCEDVYDLQCANVSDCRFYTTMSRDAWKCPVCLSRQPRGDNTNTPIRGVTAVGTVPVLNSTVEENSLNVTEVGGDAYVTTRNKKGSNPVEYSGDLSCLNDTYVNENIRVIIREEMQRVVSERLTNIISNVFSGQFASIVEKLENFNRRLDGFEAMLKLKTDSATRSINSSTNVVMNDKINASRSAQTSYASKVKPKAKAQENEDTSTIATLSTYPLDSNMIRDANIVTERSSIEAQQRDVSIVTSIDQEENKNQWTEVVKKRKTKSIEVVRGAAVPGTTQLEAAERWRYIHLYYVKLGTTDEQIRVHLSSICGDNICTVETLKARGRYASFKLGVPSHLFDKVMAPESWAKDICMKPWRQNFRNQVGHKNA